MQVLITFLETVIRLLNSVSHLDVAALALLVALSIIWKRG